MTHDEAQDPITSAVDEHVSTIVATKACRQPAEGVQPRVQFGPESLNEPLENLEPAESEVETYIHGVELVLVCISLILAVLLMTLNGSMMSTAVPHITNHFNSIADIGWYAGAYFLANCCIQPISGKIYTYFSLKYTFLMFLGIFELGSLLCGTAASSEILIIGRAVSGLGGSGIVNGAFTIFAATASIEKRPLLIGVSMATTNLGSIVGPVLGGTLVQNLSWRWCFFINLPFGFVAGVFLLCIKIPELKDRTRNSWTLKRKILELDLTGFLLFAPGIIQFLLALQWGGTRHPWDSSLVIGLFCGAFATFCLFLLWERHVGVGAMIPLHMLSRKVIYCAGVTQFFQNGGVLTLAYYLPLWFQAIKNSSPVMSGVLLLPSFISQIISTIVTGVCISRLGYYAPWGILGSMCTSIGSGLLSTFTEHTQSSKWIGYQVLPGSGRGMVSQMPITAVQYSLLPQDIPIGTSIVTFSQYLGNAVVVSLADTVFTTALRSGLSDYAPEVNVQDIIDTGATDMRHHLQGPQLTNVLLAYNQAITNVFYLAAGGCTIAVFSSTGLGWGNLKTKKKGQRDEERKGPSEVAEGDEKDVSREIPSLVHEERGIVGAEKKTETARVSS